MSRAINISFINVSQTNDIGDPAYWGSRAEHYCKNLLFDTCTLSSFDAHMGVANATIRISTLRGIGESMPSAVALSSRRIRRSAEEA